MIDDETRESLAELSETLDALAEEDDVPNDDNYEIAAELMDHPDKEMMPRLPRAQIYATLAVADAVKELTEVIKARFPEPAPPRQRTGKAYFQ